MLKNILTVSATLALLGLVQAGGELGSCPAVQLQENFDAVRYQGTWYEQARDKAMYFENYDCQQARYHLYSDLTLRVHNSQLNPKTGLIEDAFANGTCNGAQCSIKFDQQPFFAPKGDYRVVETDYDNYSIVYSCTEVLGFGKFHYVWILTRAQTISDDIKKRADEVLKAKVPSYDYANFRITKQDSTCTYLQD